MLIPIPDVLTHFSTPDHSGTLLPLDYSVYLYDMRHFGSVQMLAVAVNL